MKIRCGSKYILTLYFGITACATRGHDIPVHQAITFSAQEAAYENSSAYAEFLNTVSSNIVDYVDATNSMVQGSGFEDNRDVDANGNKDAGGARSLNHFYDPIHKIGLTDRGWPLSPAPLGRNSFDWASISNEPGVDVGWPVNNKDTYNIWAWPNARGYEWLGLTSAGPTTRSNNLANMFRAVGQVMHLLEDASQPQHVRNEEHLDQFLKMDLRSRSAIEDYYKKHTLNYPQSMLDWRNAGFTQLKDFWDRDKLRIAGASALNADLNGGASTLGIAEFCNGNFIGQRATYAEFFPDHSDIHYFAFPSLANTTQPNLKEGHLWETATHGDVTLQNFKQGTRLYISKNPGAGIPVTYHSALSYLIAQHPGKSGGLPVLTIADDNVLSNYHAIFIPKAVEYAAGLLDYFFRGTMAANVIGYDTNTMLYTNLIVNTSGQDFSGGNFSIYQDDPSGNRRLIALTNLSDALLGGDLPNGQSVTITFPGPIATTNDLLLVYQGSIGTTDPVDANIAIAAKSFQPLFEETTTTNYWVPLSVAGVSPGGTITGTLESDEVPFPITSGHYQVHVNIAYFDDKGTIGSIASTGPSTSCTDGWGNEISNTDVPAGDVSISPDGKHLRVTITATDDATCGGYIGWGQPYGPQPVTIIWQAWPAQ